MNYEHIEMIKEHLWGFESDYSPNEYKDACRELNEVYHKAHKYDMLKHIINQANDPESEFHIYHTGELEGEVDFDTEMFVWQLSEIVKGNYDEEGEG